MNFEKLSKLQKSMMFQILQILNIESGLKREDVYSKLAGSRDTKRTRVNELISMGLIEEKRKWVHNVKELYITEKGRLIADLSMKMETVLDNDYDETVDYGEQEATDSINHGTSEEQMDKVK